MGSEYNTRIMNTQKLGHQAPRLFKVNTCNSIHVKGDYAYCQSHQFLYNTELEEKKLYDGKACYYTDKRYIDGQNYFKSAYIYNTRWKSISIKAAIRKTLKCRNIPIGTIIDFNKSWHFFKKPYIDNSYTFKIRKENIFNPNYEINLSEYKTNFIKCERSQKLVNALRKNGFIVKVYQNESLIGNMLSTAKAYVGIDPKDDDNTLDGEIAIAYGFGKKIGFSSFDNDFQGYSNGQEFILWDKFQEFNKWSQCEEICKTASPNQVIKILKEN